MLQSTIAIGATHSSAESDVSCLRFQVHFLAKSGNVVGDGRIKDAMDIDDGFSHPQSGWRKKNFKKIHPVLFGW